MREEEQGENMLRIPRKKKNCKTYGPASRKEIRKDTDTTNP